MTPLFHSFPVHTCPMNTSYILHKFKFTDRFPLIEGNLELVVGAAPCRAETRKTFLPSPSITSGHHLYAQRQVFTSSAQNLRPHDAPPPNTMSKHSWVSERHCACTTTQVRTDSETLPVFWPETVDQAEEICMFQVA